MGNVRPLSELLAKHLEENGGNQSEEVRQLKDIAKRQGNQVTISRETYLKWLSGHNLPGDQYLPLLAEYLNRSIGEMSLRLTWLRAHGKGVVIELDDLIYAPVAQVPVGQLHQPILRLMGAAA